MKKVRKEVEINIPMFIGIILLIACVTAVLVYTVEYAKQVVLYDNYRLELLFDRAENLIEEESTVNVLENWFVTLFLIIKNFKKVLSNKKS